MDKQPSEELVWALPRALAGASERRAARVRRRRLLMSLRVRALGPAVRRALDVIGSLAGLVLVSPVLLVAAVLVKLTDGGPVFYHQERIGQHGRRFRLHKLRTMRMGADAQKTALVAATEGAAVDGVRFKLKVDPRVTPVGRYLRKFSVDELPQLWNVFVGDMTLVGPRPPVGREVALYDPRALRRLEVRPGLTCLWQVGGRSDIPFAEQVELDLEYIDRVGAAQEVWIVLKTIPAVLSGRGAY